MSRFFLLKSFISITMLIFLFSCESSETEFDDFEDPRRDPGASTSSTGSTGSTGSSGSNDEGRTSLPGLEKVDPGASGNSCEVKAQNCPAGERCIFVGEKSICQKSGLSKWGEVCRLSDDRCGDKMQCIRNERLRQGRGVCEQYCLPGNDSACPEGSTCVKGDSDYGICIKKKLADEMGGSGSVSTEDLCGDNSSPAEGNYCACDEGFTWCTNDPTDFDCCKAEDASDPCGIESSQSSLPDGTKTCVCNDGFSWCSIDETVLDCCEDKVNDPSNNGGNTTSGTDSSSGSGSTTSSGGDTGNSGPGTTGGDSSTGSGSTGNSTGSSTGETGSSGNTSNTTTGTSSTGSAGTSTTSGSTTGSGSTGATTSGGTSGSSTTGSATNDWEAVCKAPESIKPGMIIRKEFKDYSTITEDMCNVWLLSSLYEDVFMLDSKLSTDYVAKMKGLNFSTQSVALSAMDSCDSRSFTCKDSSKLGEVQFSLGAGEEAFLVTSSFDFSKTSFNLALYDKKDDWYDSCYVAEKLETRLKSSFKGLNLYFYKNHCNASVAAGGGVKPFWFVADQAGKYKFSAKDIGPDSHEIYLVALDRCNESENTCKEASLLGSIEVDLNENEIIHIFAVDGKWNFPEFELKAEKLP